MAREWIKGLVALVWFCGFASAQEDRPAWTAKLDERMEFSADEAPLQHALERFEKELGVDVVFDRRAMEELGVDTKMPVSFTRATLTRRKILEFLLKQLDATFVIEPEALVVTSMEASQGMQVTRLYDVRDLGLAIGEWEGRHSQAARDARPQSDAPAAVAQMGDYTSLIMLICEHVSSNSWEESGGPSSQVEVSGDILVVTQTAAVHEQIADLLKRLRNALTTRPGLAFDPPPAWAAGLDERSEFSLTGEPFRRVLDFFKSELGVPILVDQPALDELDVSLDTPVLTEPANMKRRALLRHILEPRELTFVVEPEALVITSRESAKQKLVTRIYDVDALADAMFVPAPPSRYACEELADLIRNHVGRNSWNTSGGTGGVSVLAGVLVVSQTNAIHEQIGDFLERYQAILEKRTAAKGAPRK